MKLNLDELIKKHTNEKGEIDTVSVDKDLHQEFISPLVKAKTEEAKIKREQTLLQELGVNSFDELKKSQQTTQNTIEERPKVEANPIMEAIKQLTNEVTNLKAQTQTNTYKSFVEKAGVKSDYVDDAVTFAKAHASQNQMDFTQSFETLLNKYPNWKQDFPDEGVATPTSTDKVEPSNEFDLDALAGISGYKKN